MPINLHNLPAQPLAARQNSAKTSPSETEVDRFKSHLSSQSSSLLACQPTQAPSQLPAASLDDVNRILKVNTMMAITKIHPKIKEKDL